MKRTSPLSMLLLLGLASLAFAQDKPKPEPLPNTKPLTLEGDISLTLVDGVDRFLLAELERSPEPRAKHWKRDFSDQDKYTASLEPQRKRLAYILGVRDARVPFNSLELVATLKQTARIAEGIDYEVVNVRWTAIERVHGEGLLLQPSGKPHGTIIAIPDADQTPEQFVGIVPGTPKDAQFARRLAESGYRVIVPMLINRELQQRRNVKLSNREYLYRPAFEMGRHIIGYELQSILALVDLCKVQDKTQMIGVAGWGEGGMLALYAGALDPRIDRVLVSGYFDNRNEVWREPIDRNVFGLLEQFGDAELASMIAPRRLVVEYSRYPDVTIPPNLGGGPGRITTPKLETVRKEVERANKLCDQFKKEYKITFIANGDKPCEPGSLPALEAILFDGKIVKDGEPARTFQNKFDPVARHKRLMDEIERHTQLLLEESYKVRADFMKKLDVKSLDAYEKSTKEYREFFSKEVIGEFERPLLKPDPRSRKLYDKEKWTGYEVVLDVFPDVIAYGVLLVPKGIKKGEKRPVVVCQHGLEGKPKDVIEGDHPAYHDFAAKLAERGFITFAPQNLYIGKDRFRTLQRKANPLKKTLFSVITPQHQQIINWLKTLPEVDEKRIAFYGLSYGGKTAMRVPAILTDYCLSICSADFNEWVWKNASTSSTYSYVNTIEYEIFEFDLGHTFNYAEMAALIAPRPFMVERGHRDGVAPDEKVAHEYAKVRNLYQARLKIGERTTIEWFDGPHTINGKGTFDFLHTHLNWPK